jgi:hypothetical protein
MCPSGHYSSIVPFRHRAPNRLRSPIFGLKREESHACFKQKEVREQMMETHEWKRMNE